MQTDSNHKLSVILPTYNGSKYIKDAIESILMQDFDNFELIIINDCSSDNTLEIIEQYAKKDSRIRVFSNSENLKLPKSLNFGFSKATGEYFTWTSDDNIFKQGALKFMVEYLDKNPDADLISCSFDKIDENNNLLMNADNLSSRQSTAYLASYCNVGPCFMYRKTIADKVGGYDSDMFCGEDYDYWCRIAIAGNIHYVKNNFYKYRVQSQNLSSTQVSKLLNNTAVIHQKYANMILEKYKISNEGLADIYYTLWKHEDNSDYVKKAFKACAARALVKFGLYHLRQFPKKIFVNKT